jgi:hypothetical protein
VNGNQHRESSEKLLRIKFTKLSDLAYQGQQFENVTHQHFVAKEPQTGAFTIIKICHV